MILYNLFPLLAGPLHRWEPHLDRARALGFNWLFLNPIQLPGASGSLYSIADYFRFNPRLLNPADPAPPETQIQRLAARARERGLRLMIDLVINHCAIDSPLIREHPQWFVRQPDGRPAHPSCQHHDQTVVWTDLAQFDHQHPRDPEGFYRYCRRVVDALLALGFDGFRCDAAYQIPRPFWQRLIHDTRQRHPHACFAAETLGCSPAQTLETARAGFDYVFNSSKWWDFHGCWLLEQYNLIREITRSISFPESHDTPRLAAELNGNPHALKQRYLFAALFAAGVMMPIGFEFGFRKPLHVVNSQPADWEPVHVDLSDFITRVNHLKLQHPVFREESPASILPTDNPNILLLWKASVQHPQEALLILNKDPHHHQDFHTDHFRRFIQSGAPLRDVSPEYPLDYLPEPFHYALRPGQGIVLVTTRS
ncbi:MAG: alpha-amylase [Verrucomicrobia bacterium]|nr:alpha-amylase [Verrucomicrobiota bacterium]OQC23792.1 MAG: Alpha-1,4-glucan:maltose-1-phosphate maltosyltransferase 1 [Verrucomicrobia bacterium ADurb.Bin063]HRY59540.1 alpha-amylase family glycosyl hydrolase [Candidatus Paceibacterota bacterium]MBP8015895.1 alpha-amylase [Verrucomicrobiota bacterium]HNR72064.1 alpha-amylase family glycosyl hydrolase [Verrucomicrobiota bacterium]